MRTTRAHGLSVCRAKQSRCNAPRVPFPRTHEYSQPPQVSSAEESSRIREETQVREPRATCQPAATMDLVYIPDVLSFGSFRSPQYRDYEQSWNRNYYDDGKMTSYQQQRQQQQQQQRQRENKGSCHLCKESKRRSLAAYIRGKTRNNSCSEICEEEEEEEVVENEQQQPQQPQQTNPKSSHAEKTKV